MKIKKLHITITLFVTVLILLSFRDDPNKRITLKNVTFLNPKGFPKPTYNFETNKLSPDKFILGRKLFYDNLLSKDNTVNCGTCHQQFAAFAHIDHKLSHGIYNKIGNRNVPALQNLIWNDSYMWDGGVNNLEVQPINPITNPIEMDESIVNVLAKLKKDSSYVALFKKAYNDTLINSERLLKSLAQFTSLLISSNSRYDKFVNKLDTLSGSEKAGLALFKNKCSSCHAEPLFTDNSFRDNGIEADSALNDIGRAKVTGLDKDKHTFKVPSLRNVEMTFPYMHDGRFKSLEQVVNHYADPSNFSSTAEANLKKIGVLSQIDKLNLIAFLKTLTDKAFLYDRRFADPSSR
jgi:cytochrome c peroxidase